MLCGLYKNAAQAQLIQILYQEENIKVTLKEGFSHKDAELAGVSVRTGTRVKSAFRSLGRMLLIGSKSVVDRSGQVKKTRGENIPQVTMQDVIILSRWDQPD